MSDLGVLPDGTIRRSSLKDQAVKLLRSHIIAGSIAPGTQLVERDLATYLGISRAPTREALMELESQGLVVNQRGRRRVIDPTGLDIENMFDVRTPLEQRAAERAAEQTNGHRQQQLSARLAEMHSAVARQDRPAFVIADLQLHQEIWRQADNRYLDRVLNDMSGPVFLAIVNGSYEGFDWNETFELHRRLVDTINAGDARAAVDMAGRNMKSAVDRNSALPI